MDLKAKRIIAELERGLRVPREDREYLIEYLYREGHITDDGVKEVFNRFMNNIHKELGLEDELRFTKYEENKALGEAKGARG